MKALGITLLLVFLVAVSGLAIWAEVYSLQSPEAYLAVRRAEWYVAGGSVALLAVAGLTMWGWISITARIRSRKTR